ncbi:unnamed protein product [Hermetia illucens]|uniref:Uncharacterized protein n=1 Tax=Hermetia illucens TaxID=343691 RepID=A0A7R8UN25_HERIL|nr:unnamed protein product [Hermetia illucens]
MFQAAKNDSVPASDKETAVDFAIVLPFGLLCYSALALYVVAFLYIGYHFRIQKGVKLTRYQKSVSGADQGDMKNPIQILPKALKSISHTEDDIVAISSAEQTLLFERQ